MEKREAYKRLLKWIFEMLRSTKQDDFEERKKDLEKEFFEVARDMAVYASDDVLRRYLLFRTGATLEQPELVMGAFSGLLLAVRKDLGHDRSKIGDQEILALFISDWEQYAAASRTQSNAVPARGGR